MWIAKNTEATWESCESPYSFYHQFIAKYWDGGPSEGAGAPIHRLCTLARKMDARSFVVEDSALRPDVAEEIEHLQQCSELKEGEVSAATITFLTTPVDGDGKVDGILSEQVIGQVTIITFPHGEGGRSYIFDALFRLPRKGTDQLLNNHVHVCKVFDISVRGHKVEIPASYFCQQNGVTSFCAHCAVRTLVRTLTDEPVSVSALNKLWSFDPDLCRVDTMKVQEALKHFGLRPIAYDLTTIPKTISKNAPDNIWATLALLADSGSPALLVLSSGVPADHVVPVLGHTFNSDEWHPLGETLHVNGSVNVASSNGWIDHLVIHDDMLGPYFCLSRAGLFPSTEEPLKPKRVLAVVPEGVKMSPLMAEHYARNVMPRLLTAIERAGMGQGTWWEFFQKALERRIFRTTLVARNDYVKTLDEVAVVAFEKDQVASLAKSLPEQIWMCELTLPNLLLANRAKLGELLIDSQAFPDEGDPLSGLCAFRLPSLLGWLEPLDKGLRSFSVVDWPQVDHQPIRAPSHHPNRW